MKKYRKKKEIESPQIFTKTLLTMDILNIAISGWYIIFYWSKFQDTISSVFIKVWFIIWAIIAIVLILKYTMVRYKPQIKKTAKKLDQDDFESIARIIHDLKEG